MARARAPRWPGTGRLKAWFDDLPNADLSALHYQGGAAWRERLSADLGKQGRRIPQGRRRCALARCSAILAAIAWKSLVEAFDAATDDVPTLFIAWTIKGYGLPFAGHKDNHAGLMNPKQMAALRDSMGMPKGDEWAPLEGLGDNVRAGVEALLRTGRIARAKNATAVSARSQSRTPRARRRGAIDPGCFGRILNDLAGRRRPCRPYPHHLSRRHRVDQPRRVREPARAVRAARTARCFRRSKDCFDAKVVIDNNGQHVELGIAENNLFLMLAAAGPVGDMFGQRLFPSGRCTTRSSPRGLDALNYACYQDARFLLVATPSGVTLGPEGGAHQSINPPLIALGQPGLRHYEPAFADELAAMMEEAFRLIDDPDGESTYLRLSTRAIVQVDRDGDAWKAGALAGGYWLKEPAQGAEAAIVAMGAVMPEALATWEEFERGHSGARPARRHFARLAPPGLDRGTGRSAGTAVASSVMSSSCCRGSRRARAS